MRGTPTVVARAPTRIDLGGGWTDVPPYSDEEGGFVCSFAIDRRATAHVSVAAVSAGGAPKHVRGESALAVAALRRAQTLNTGATPALHLLSDFPLGAGLGGSSAAGVAAIGALLAHAGEARERAEIAELSRAIEVEDLGIAGGRQDHYAAAFGGALGLSFEQGRVTVDTIQLSEKLVNELERRCVLLYTGQSRISSTTITAVLDGYRERQARICIALSQMKELARRMADALRRASVDELAALVGEHWMHQRALHPGISTPRIDAIMETARHEGAMGGKAMGASGGGCVLLISTADGFDRLRAAVAPLGELIPFHLDMSGLAIAGGETALEPETT